MKQYIRSRQPVLIAGTVIMLLCTQVPSPHIILARGNPPVKARPARKPIKLGPGYVRAADKERRLYYVSALDKEHLVMTANLLGRFSDSFNKTLRVQRPRWDVTILLPTTEDYRLLGRGRNVVGFYSPPDRMLISIDRGRVLIHEFTHALHHADANAAAQQHPIWIWEGLASLFDAAEIKPSGLQPQVDLRILPLQSALRSGKTVPLSRLIKMKPDAFARNADLCYPQVRYLMFYIYQQGKLSKWYETYKATFNEDPTGKYALQKVLSKRLRQIEEDWCDWAQTLQLPWGERQAGRARLGMQLQNTKNGVKVAGFVKGSAAERAGRIEVGDIVLKIDRHKVSNTAEAIGAIHALGAMQTVTIELNRHGRVMTVHQPLGAPQRK